MNARTSAQAAALPRRTRPPCGRRSCAARPGRSTSRWSTPAAVEGRRRTRRSPRAGCPVGAAEQAEDRRPRIWSATSTGAGASFAPRPDERAVDADRRRPARARASRPGTTSGRPCRSPSVKSVAGAGRSSSAPELLDRGGDVGRDPGPRRLLDVGHVLEALAARLDGPPSARTSRSPARRCRARRTAGRAPRSTGGGRGRRAGSRSPAPLGSAARARNAREPVAVGRRQHQRASSRARRRRSARSAGGCRGRST